MVYNGLPFPARYFSLPRYPEDHPHSLEVVGNVVAQKWVEHLRRTMKRYRYLGVILDPTNPEDFNSIPIVLLADHANEFNDWSYQVSLDFWRKASPEGTALKAVTFPLHIHHENWTQVIHGQPVQMLREAASRPVLHASCDHASCDHASCDHASCDHASCDHASCDSTACP
jgi:hypothetical protein